MLPMRAITIFGAYLLLGCYEVASFSLVSKVSTRCSRHVVRNAASGKSNPGGKNDRVAVNKSARRNYEILEDIECGIEMTGTEVKACRQGSMNIEDGYAQFKDGECWLKNVHIGPHPSSGAFFQHEAKRDRRLLLHKKEILKLSQQVMRAQYTLVPLIAYFNDRNILKVKIGVAKGKDDRDKRQDIMKREVGRELQRAVKTLKGGL